MDITKLSGIIPDEIYNELTAVVANSFSDEITIAHFLGQCEVESSSFTHFIENLNYSSQALFKLFPSHFADQSDADNYNRQPEKIANRIYANRMGNGDEESGDGWKYRGRGAIQLTGKQNQTSFFTSINLEINSDPQIISDHYNLISALWFWNSRNISDICTDASDLVITQVTKKVNGGNIGLAQRITATNKFYNLLTT
jgi:putative chitinase